MEHGVYLCLFFLTLIEDSIQIEDNKIPGLCAGQPGIPGTPGIHGNPGLPGRDGHDGRDGAAGMLGEKGEVGQPGPPGQRRESGSPGINGLPGEKGIQGECTVAPRSAFSAKRSESHSPPPPANQPIVFDVMLINEQGHYDGNTSKFGFVEYFGLKCRVLLEKLFLPDVSFSAAENIFSGEAAGAVALTFSAAVLLTKKKKKFLCEIPGLYYFAVHATVYHMSLQFDIMKNGKSVASFQFYGNWPKPTSLSGGTLVRLEPEDEVRVQVGVVDFYSSVKTDSTFTGFLVYSYWPNSCLCLTNNTVPTTVAACLAENSWVSSSAINIIH